MFINLSYFLCISEAATDGQSCSNSIPCDTDASSCDTSTGVCTCDYGDFAASIDKCKFLQIYRKIIHLHYSVRNIVGSFIEIWPQKLPLLSQYL